MCAFIPHKNHRMYPESAQAATPALRTKDQEKPLEAPIPSCNEHGGSSTSLGSLVPGLVLPNTPPVLQYTLRLLQGKR